MRQIQVEVSESPGDEINNCIFKKQIVFIINCWVWVSRTFSCCFAVGKTVKGLNVHMYNKQQPKYQRIQLSISVSTIYLTYHATSDIYGRW